MPRTEWGIGIKRKIIETKQKEAWLCSAFALINNNFML